MTLPPDPNLPTASKDHQDDKSSDGNVLMRALVGFVLKSKLVVLLLMLLLIGIGLSASPFEIKPTQWPLVGDSEIARAVEGIPRHPVSVDAIPDLGENQQVIFTRWTGQSPQDVQDQLTYPLTTSVLGMSGVKSVRSQSFFGFSSVYVIFEDDVDFYWSRTRILEKLNSLPPGTLPEGVKPQLGPEGTGLGQVYWYTLQGRNPRGKPIGGWDLDELRSVQDWYVRYGLMSADGVAEVASVGGYSREYHIDLNPDLMRNYAITLAEVMKAVQNSNQDIGARTMEINRVEYLLRGVGLVEDIKDLENIVIKTIDGIPLKVSQVATVDLGPAPRRGIIDVDGAEAVGGVVLARYGENPLHVIDGVKQQVDAIASGMPRKAVVHWQQVTRDEVEAFAQQKNFPAWSIEDDNLLNQEAWLAWMDETKSDQWPAWLDESKLTIQPFYDRSGIIRDTIATLGDALWLQILITMIVVLVMLKQPVGGALISSMMPLTVLITFIIMRLINLDANVVSLAGIAIAIGTIVDMGIVLIENIVTKLNEMKAGESRFAVIRNASAEVGSAILTAMATTVISFLPVFLLTGPEGKMFTPLAYTKTIVLIVSLFVAMTVLPAAVMLLMRNKPGKYWRWVMIGVLVMLTIALSILELITNLIWTGPGYFEWMLGSFLFVPGFTSLLILWLFYPFFWNWLKESFALIFSIILALLLGVYLTQAWMPLGYEQSFQRNLGFTFALCGGLLLTFKIFEWIYPFLLSFFLRHKLIFLTMPVLLLLMGMGWANYGYLASMSFPERMLRQYVSESLADDYLNLLGDRTEDKLPHRLEVKDSRPMIHFGPASELFPEPQREFMPKLDEGSFLYMPIIMPHGSVTEASEVLARLDQAIKTVPEVELVVGKMGRAESPLDPAPLSMVETVIQYRPEYVVDEWGRPKRFEYDTLTHRYLRDEAGQVIEYKPGGLFNRERAHVQGRPIRQWRKHIQSPDDIWQEIVKVTEIPGVTGASKLQPIETRLVMLATGMRAPIGIKIIGPDLQSIEQVGLELERIIKATDGVNPGSVNADRIIGKPYLTINIDRQNLGQYGLSVVDVQRVINTVVGGREMTMTIEGRERYAVRMRYAREKRGSIEALDQVLVDTPAGAPIPLSQVAEIGYEAGPQMIKSEDSFLVGYLTFGQDDPSISDIQLVQRVQEKLNEMQASKELVLPNGVTYSFEGTYRDELRASKTMNIAIIVALIIILMILYLQFRSLAMTLVVFSGIMVAWSGGYVLLWLYNQPWFMDVEVYGVNLRALLNIGPVNMSLAVFIGFLVLFGIASDDGVVIATYIKQAFKKHQPQTLKEIREVIHGAGCRRVRACLMTTATTLLALIPVLTSDGRGSEIMIPMAIPVFGGMLFELLTMFVVPVLYCLIVEICKLPQRGFALVKTLA